MRTREDYLRGSYALIISELTPEILRRPALSDESFAKGLGLVIDGLVNFASAGTSFHRSDLVKAVRDASAANPREASVTDEAGQSWTVKIASEDGAPAVTISREVKEIRVPHL